MAETIPGGKYINDSGVLVDANGVPLPVEKPKKAPKPAPESESEPEPEGQEA